MLQSMIMNVCVQCVFIVTTKCKAMRNIHLEEQDDQETSNLFYLYMFLYFITPIYFRPSFNNKRKIVTTRKKHINVDMGFTVGQVSLNRDIELSWKLLQKLTFDVITD